MRNNRLIIRAVFAVFILVGITSCTFEEPVLKSFDGLEMTETEGDSSIVILNFTVENPNRKKIKLKTAEFDISVNNIKVGRATLIGLHELPAKGTYQVPLKMNLQLDKSNTELAVTLGLAVLMNNLELEIVGEANGSMGFIHKSLPIEYTQKIDWDDLKKLVL